MNSSVKKRPYAGIMAVLATKHGKEQQIARPLRVAVGLEVCVAADIDTDVLGTFTGEIPRPGPPEQVVVQKAPLGMDMTGLSYGLANEGSFGPHPHFPFLIVNTELLLFIDDKRGIQVQEVMLTEQTIAAQCKARSLDDLETFLPRVLFPSHALIVRPHALLRADLVVKGIRDVAILAETIKRYAHLSPDGYALVETDLRAHMNPTRRKVIRRLAVRLGRRLACLCPRCETPGWGRVDVVRGLPCEWCGEETELVAKEVLGCASCTYRAEIPRADGMQYAPAAQCAFCNP
jgi:hypothetical protein